MGNPDPRKKDRLARVAKKVKEINLKAVLHSDIRVLNLEAEHECMTWDNKQCKTPLEKIGLLQWYCSSCRCEIKFSYRVEKSHETVTETKTSRRCGSAKTFEEMDVETPVEQVITCPTCGGMAIKSEGYEFNFRCTRCGGFN